MKCPKCGRFVSAKQPCSKCWQYAATITLPGDLYEVEIPGLFEPPREVPVPLWRRILRILKSIICLGGE